MALHNHVKDNQISAQLNTRVGEAIQDVTDQVENHGGNGHINSDGFDHWKITSLNSQNDFSAYTWDAKESFQQKSTKQQT